MLYLPGGHKSGVFCSQGGIGVFVGQESQSGCDGNTAFWFVVSGFAVYSLHLGIIFCICESIGIFVGVCCKCIFMHIFDFTCVQETCSI